MSEKDKETLQNTPVGIRFDHQLYELLKKSKKGAFIGEYHEFPALRQALIYIAPAIKALGVTTLSVELPQSDIDAMLKAQSADEFLKSSLLGVLKDKRPEEWYNLVHAYHKLGIKVLGHEEETEVRAKRMVEEFQKKLKALMEDPMKKAMAKIEEDAKKIADPKERERFKQDAMVKARDAIMETKEVKRLLASLTDGSNRQKELTERNIFAADHIEKHAVPGMKLVVGGGAHSQYCNSAPDSLEKPGEKEGLDKRLGIPAINIEPVDGKGGLAGETKAKIPGKAYEVVLPVDLKELKITSWPPAGGPPAVLPYNQEKTMPMAPAARTPPVIPRK